ncbi:MAG: hypothetical protein ABIJ21_05525 [Nanoarchaeota archaeon]
MSEDTRLILEKLDSIKIELDFIKKNMIDFDSILTKDDLTALQNAEREFKEGRTKRLK